METCNKAVKRLTNLLSLPLMYNLLPREVNDVMKLLLIKVVKMTQNSSCLDIHALTYRLFLPVRDRKVHCRSSDKDAFLGTPVKVIPSGKEDKLYDI